MAFGDRLAPYIADTPPIAWDGLDRDSSSCSRARRARCSTSTTAPIRSSPRRTRSPAPRASARASGPRRSTRCGASPRPTAPASAPGPFPTELDDEVGERIREAGGEFGTTTGRARRCGWLDLVALRYAVRVNGLTGLVLTKLDVLTGIDPMPVATRYTGPDGATFDDFPYHQSVLHHARGETTSSCPAGTRTSPAPGRWPTCRPRARLPRLHRGAARHPDRDDRRGPRPRPDHLDRGRQDGASAADAG